mmetsp:Transcript_30060/g.48024  ORF Transcript_30060/g.48024 Transcript_30060/m.48024 type:complete len:201 (+) Transcript_30060:712-1314(+)
MMGATMTTRADMAMMSAAGTARNIKFFELVVIQRLSFVLFPRRKRRQFFVFTLAYFGVDILQYTFSIVVSKHGAVFIHWIKYSRHGVNTNDFRIDEISFIELIRRHKERHWIDPRSRIPDLLDVIGHDGPLHGCRPFLSIDLDGHASTATNATGSFLLDIRIRLERRRQDGTFAVMVIRIAFNHNRSARARAGEISAALS